MFTNGIINVSPCSSREMDVVLFRLRQFSLKNATKVYIFYNIQTQSTKKIKLSIILKQLYIIFHSINISRNLFLRMKIT